MAFTIKKYNKGGKFDINTANLPYVTLKRLYTDNGEDGVYAIGAIFINKKSKFGEAPVVPIMDMDAETGEIKAVALCNLPRHLLEICVEMMRDDEAVDAIKAYKVGFTIRKYHSNVYNTDAYSVDWVDLE